MTKDKKGGPANKHLHARIAYLNEAAVYLATQKPHESVAPQPKQSSESQGIDPDEQSHEKSLSESSASFGPSRPLNGGLSVHLASHLRQVAQKAIIRLSPEIKRSICKTCNSVLVESKTSKKYVENLSRKGAKAHADVMVIECCLCGTKKRVPIGATRQPKKARRSCLTKVETGGAKETALVEGS
nr:ribonuclease p protein subunit rpr2 [Quercus suber]